MSMRNALWICAIALVGAGCDVAGDDPVTQRQGPAQSTPDRGRVLGGERVERSVRWPRTIDTDTLEALSPEARAEVGRSPAPVLLPPSSDPLAGGMIATGATWWAYSAKHADVTLSIHASTAARVHGHIEPVAGTDRVRGLPARAEIAEGIRTLSWIEHGVAYGLEIECADPSAPACADDTLARSVASRLTNVGGRGGAR